MTNSDTIEMATMVDFVRFCEATGRDWRLYSDIPFMREFASWFGQSVAANSYRVAAQRLRDVTAPFKFDDNFNRIYLTVQESCESLALEIEALTPQAAQDFAKRREAEIERKARLAALTEFRTAPPLGEAPTLTETIEAEMAAATRRRLARNLCETAIVLETMPDEFRDCGIAALSEFYFRFTGEDFDWEDIKLNSKKVAALRESLSQPPRVEETDLQRAQCKCGHDISIHEWDDDISSHCLAATGRGTFGTTEGSPCLCSGFRPRQVLCICGEQENQHIGKPRGIPGKCAQFVRAEASRVPPPREREEK